MQSDEFKKETNTMNDAEVADLHKIIRGQPLSFTPQLLKGVLNEEKTQTRRLVKAGDTFFLGPALPGRPLELLGVHSPFGRLRWQIDCICKVLPGRGKKAVAEIRVLQLRNEDARNISHEDAVAECCGDPYGFLWKWTTFYDRDGIAKLWEGSTIDGSPGPLVLAGQPSKLYNCIAINFELVEVY